MSVGGDIMISREQVERWRAERADLLQRITRLDRRLALIAEIVSEIATDEPRPIALAPTVPPVSPLAVVHSKPVAAQSAPSIASTLEQALGMDVGQISAGVVALSEPASRDAASVSHFRTLQPAAVAG